LYKVTAISVHLIMSSLFSISEAHRPGKALLKYYEVTCTSCLYTFRLILTIYLTPPTNEYLEASAGTDCPTCCTPWWGPAGAPEPRDKRHFRCLATGVFVVSTFLNKLQHLHCTKSNTRNIMAENPDVPRINKAFVPLGKSGTQTLMEIANCPNQKTTQKHVRSGMARLYAMNSI
jgi:hypothetical protein